MAIKGPVSRDFYPRFNGTPGGPDSWAVLNIDSNSQNNLIRFDAEIDSTLCRRARSRFLLLLLDNANLTILFYCHGSGKII
jgi:hypothetical protein